MYASRAQPNDTTSGNWKVESRPYGCDIVVLPGEEVWVLGDVGMVVVLGGRAVVEGDVGEVVWLADGDVVVTGTVTKGAGCRSD
ncbi:hypothetical protein DW322_05930 [Rhodococcus rhodnii]|uniref:Uncharacterized protein n=2 Tax=Rhodococcus rhodnii TaxID=38312 RepID=R7WHR8_9NOCA|nr:hypothetical protein [Rhodococcus rhodnii]EOM74735.1 hypothetical protein Rrhod_3898 [Rhodococcus rhodnii LMG 5362]TXG89837.1 hypothetical protein DW322_05930 [Rhodococcus rhodnii]